MSVNQDADVNSRLQAAFAMSVHDHWVLFLIEGIVLLGLGLMAFLIPPLATLGVTIVLGWLFFISGTMGLITTVWARQAPGFWWSMVSALLGFGAGLVLLARPVSGAISLTLVLIVFFVIEGIASVMYSLECRQQSPGRWGWMLVSGIIDLILAGIIFTGLPETAAWAPGLLVGINMMFGGAALVAIALHSRNGIPAEVTSAPSQKA